MAEKTLTTRQKQKYDTAQNWSTNNPTLLAGEIGFESDTNKFKVGNGANAWNELDYAGGGDLKLYFTTGQNTDGAMTQKAVTDELNNKVQKTNSKNNYVGTIDNLESSGSVQISCNYNNQYETILEIGSTHISSTSPIYEGNVTDENKLLKMSELPTVDAELSSTSENAVQNKVITTALNSKANTQDVPTALSELTEDTTHRTVTDTEKQTWNSKVEQEDLDSLKTSINTKVSIGKSSGANTSYINNNGSSIELIIGSGVETLSKIVIDSSGNVTIGGSSKITINGLTADVNPQTDFKTMPTVSSSPIVSSGSNTNGYYTKFADGTLICRYSFTDKLLSGHTVTFPHPFISTEDLSIITQQVRDNGISAQWINGQAINKVSKTGFNVYAGYSESSTIYWKAIGRWK